MEEEILINWYGRVPSNIHDFRVLRADTVSVACCWLEGERSIQVKALLPTKEKGWIFLHHATSQC